ncbi:hypothetical protein C8Q74DRAFT_528441 [Fomes fomentarius]|nr:hypothetical protein C8Q74DRAFT_528441 [Fomes fomentarius]
MGVVWCGRMWWLTGFANPARPRACPSCVLSAYTWDVSLRHHIFAPSVNVDSASEGADPRHTSCPGCPAIPRPTVTAIYLTLRRVRYAGSSSDAARRPRVRVVAHLVDLLPAASSGRSTRGGCGFFHPQLCCYTSVAN